MKEKLLKDFIGYKVSLTNPTPTTTKFKMYKIEGVRYGQNCTLNQINTYYSEIEVINDNGRLISLLAKRFNFNSFSKG